MPQAKKPRANASELETRIHSRVPNELRAELERAAKDANTVPSVIVRKAIAGYVGRPELGLIGTEEAA